MKSIMSALVVLMMAVALVSIGGAAIGSLDNHTPAGVAVPHNSTAGAGVRDADNPGVFPTGTPYPCIASPAYLDYTNARAVPCPLNDEARRVPDPMGSPGL